MKTLRFVLILVAMATASACEKNAVLEIAEPQVGGANVKFFNFAVGSPSVNFYVNNQKVTAVSATGCYLLDDANRAECLSSGREATTGVAYGGAGNGVNAWYSAVDAGTVTISGKIAGETDKNLAISNLQATVADGKFYSYYLSGVYDGVNKTAESFILEDVLPAADFTVAYVRFVNASAGTQPMILYAKDRLTQQEVALGTAVAYMAGGSFVAVPEASYDLFTRVEGSATNVITRTAVTFTAGRVYTVTARGSTAKALDNTANR